MVPELRRRLSPVAAKPGSSSPSVVLPVFSRPASTPSVLEPVLPSISPPSSNILPPSSGIGRKCGSGQQEDEDCASAHPIGCEERRGAEQTAGGCNDSQRRRDAQHPQPSAPKEGRRVIKGQRR
nr:putative histone H2A [Ipomoea batatas]